MESFIEILKIILPTLITGICTFLITKYSYNKNVPLDKMETAYTKIYQPIYKMINGRKFKDIRNKTNNINRLISEISTILKINNEYADRLTLRLFDVFYKNKDKETYTNFKNNIINKYLYLRKRLGYLELNIFQVYKYFPKEDKLMFRFIIEFINLYIVLTILSISKGIIKYIFICIILIIIIIIIIDLIIFYIVIIKILIKYYKIRFKK